MTEPTATELLNELESLPMIAMDDVGCEILSKSNRYQEIINQLRTHLSFLESHQATREMRERDAAMRLWEKWGYYEITGDEAPFSCRMFLSTRHIRDERGICMMTVTLKDGDIELFRIDTEDVLAAARKLAPDCEGIAAILKELDK